MSVHISHHPETPSHLPPHPIPLGCPRAPALGALLHALNLHWSSILHMVIYMFQCYSLISFSFQFMSNFFGYEKFPLSFLLLPSVAAQNLSAGVFNKKNKNNNKKNLGTLAQERRARTHICPISCFSSICLSPHSLRSEELKFFVLI